MVVTRWLSKRSNIEIGLKMSVLFIQISDIHIKDTNGPTLSRLQKVAQAVQHLDTNVATAVIVLSGDVAHSGTKDEYQQTSSGLKTLLSELSTVLKGTSIHLLGVPGNHDCDFKHPMVQARKLLLESLTRSSTESVDESTLGICCQLQNEFFAFLDQHQTLKPSYNIARTYYEYLIPTGNENILFRCFNTAFSSMLPESAGRMIYPLPLLRDRTIVPAPAYVVAVLHHPYNWFAPNIKRALSDHIERTCDVIFTGHEHTTAYYKKEASSGLVTEYIEGAVFQEHSVDSCGFNAVLVNIESSQERFYEFEWDTDHFVQKEVTDGWRPFRRSRTRREFELSDKMLQYLQDPGATFNHPAKPKLLLEDIFVPPNAQELTFKEGNDLVKKGNIASKDLLNFIANRNRVLVIGRERSGKTTLAKVLFRHFYGKDLVPILLTFA